MSRKKYPTDLTDQQWQIIKDMLPTAKSEVAQGRKRTTDLREVVTATAAIIDSQSIKNTDFGEAERGFDGNKKVNGRKRHLLVDTLRLVLLVLVQSANIADVAY